MPIPLYGFMQGDTVGLLILAEEDDAIETLAGKLQDAASIRVARIDHVQVIYNDKSIDPALTVAQAGFEALDRFDVISDQQK
jgi:hypothetical protein